VETIRNLRVHTGGVTFFQARRRGIRGDDLGYFN
jgi:hypothetical protein